MEGVLRKNAQGIKDSLLGSTDGNNNWENLISVLSLVVSKTPAGKTLGRDQRPPVCSRGSTRGSSEVTDWSGDGGGGSVESESNKDPSPSLAIGRWIESSRKPARRLATVCLSCGRCNTAFQLLYDLLRKSTTGNNAMLNRRMSAFSSGQQVK